MICPECKVEINEVVVIREVCQTGILNGNKIIDFTDTHTIEGITEIQCPECYSVLPEDVVY